MDKYLQETKICFFHFEVSSILCILEHNLVCDHL